MNHTTPNSQAAAYLRAKDRKSLAAQLEAICARAAQDGFTITNAYFDLGSSSGVASGCKGQIDLLDDLGTGRFSVVYVSSLDRLTRSVSLLTKMIQRLTSSNVTLKVLDSGFDSSRPESCMFLNILTALGADGSNKAYRRHRSGFLSETKA
ncbi:MAG: recombinase family protein [Anaerolineae bacterium]|nr:recombinase family protein [Anaerolineae bacterium]